MTSFDDLGRALRAGASACAPPASRLDVDAAIAAARARRRPRQWGAGALGVIAVLGLGGVAVAAVTPPALIAASESSEGGDQLLSQEGAVDDEAVSEGVATTTSSDEQVTPLSESCDGPAGARGEGASGLQVAVALPVGSGTASINGLSCANGVALEPGAYSVVIELELGDPATGGSVTITGPSMTVRVP